MNCPFSHVIWTRKHYTFPLFLTAAIFEMMYEINILLQVIFSKHLTQVNPKRNWIAKCSETGINLSVEPYYEERGSAVFWLLHFLSLLLDGVSFLLSPGCSSSDVILNYFHSSWVEYTLRSFPHTWEGSICLASRGVYAIYVWTAEQGSGGCVYTTMCIQWDKALKSLFKINTTV